MTQAQPIITVARAEAYIASALRLLCWLVGEILRFGWKGRGVRLQRLLSRAERGVECVLFLKALALHGPPPPRRSHPRSTPPGFRRVYGRGRLFFKGVRIRAGKNAGAPARVIALIDALARPERAVAHFLKQIAKGTRVSHLVATAPSACAVASEAPIAVAFCDSS